MESSHALQLDKVSGENVGEGGAGLLAEGTRGRSGQEVLR
jgi:hypothetical protein